MEEIDEARRKIMLDQLDSATLAAMRAAYQPGAVVEVIHADGLVEGEKAVVKHVNADGAVVILLLDGTVRQVAFRKGSLRRLLDHGCFLQKREWSSGGCGKEKCAHCGWDAEECRARTKRIREEGLTGLKSGKKYFRIQHNKG